MLTLIYQSMKRSKRRFALLIVQFTIGFVALLFSFSAAATLWHYKQTVASLAPLTTVHPYIVEDIGQHDDRTAQYADAFAQLKQQRIVERLGLFETMTLYRDREHETTLYTLNDDSFALAHFPLQAGTLPNKQTTDTIPIVVSDALQHEYKLGKTYERYYYNETGEQTTVTIQVVGVLMPEARFWQGGATHISTNITTNERFIVAPDFIPFTAATTYATNALVQIEPAQMAKMTALFAERGLSLRYNTLQDEVDHYNDGRFVVIVSTMAFAAILLILALLGSIGAILASIATRYREFGIYYALGLTKRHLIRLVCGEIAVTLWLSFVSATLLCQLIVTTVLSDESLTLTTTTIALTFALTIVCFLLATMMPFIKLRKLEPLDLLKGAHRS